MREIKFRVWKKTNTPEMFNDIAYIDFKNRSIGINYRISFLAHRIDVEDINNVIIMQYTGLKDKNGVEIYEGDVLSGWIGSHWHSGEDKFEEVVKYDEKTASYNFAAIEVRYGDLRVIGNIYENPELLEVQNG